MERDAAGRRARVLVPTAYQNAARPCLNSRFHHESITARIRTQRRSRRKLARVKDEDHKGGFVWSGLQRARAEEGERQGEKGSRGMRRYTRVAVAHASLLPPSSPPDQASSFLHECTRYRRTPIVSIFSALLSRVPAALYILLFFSSLFFSPSRLLAPPFFYFPTIIILSNFAHSKRWRKFVEVTPRENAEDSVQNKEPGGEGERVALFIPYAGRTRRPPPPRVNVVAERGGLERILLVKCRAHRSH